MPVSNRFGQLVPLPCFPRCNDWYIIYGFTWILLHSLNLTCDSDECELKKRGTNYQNYKVALVIIVCCCGWSFFFLTFFNAVSFSFFPIEPIFYSLWQSKTTNMEIGKIKPRKSFSITLSHFNNSIPVLIWICPLKLFFESSFNSSLSFDVHLFFFFLTTSMLCSSLLSFWTNINL